MKLFGAVLRSCPCFGRGSHAAGRPCISSFLQDFHQIVQADALAACQGNLKKNFAGLAPGPLKSLK
ncbi:hypothetical protein CSB45_12980 [candidate division KSB3 bacterium]|uniref:Uncharacterized protein n=1 Tax=candidate division KSB3 bacterium TaxID=2044937 RepID=A0A2G6E2N1_9BACT|nr:MAG: hypothetical protein CSB45_12980 [candidate division KSB3 bacterium]